MGLLHFSDERDSGRKAGGGSDGEAFGCEQMMIVVAVPTVEARLDGFLLLCCPPLRAREGVAQHSREVAMTTSDPGCGRKVVCGLRSTPSSPTRRHARPMTGRRGGRGTAESRVWRQDGGRFGSCCAS
jgi:hypothetical protein